MSLIALSKCDKVSEFNFSTVVAGVTTRKLGNFRSTETELIEKCKFLTRELGGGRFFICNSRT